MSGQEVLAFELASMGHTADPYEAAAVSRGQQEVMARLADLRDGRWLELHYIGLPSLEEPWRSSVRVALFAGSTGPGDGRLTELACSLQSSLAYPSAFYEFHRVEDETRVQELWRPFPLNCSVEFQRVFVPAIAAVDSRPAVRADDAVEFGALARALLASAVRSRVRIALVPTRLFPWEQLSCARMAGSSESLRWMDELMQERDRLFLARFVVESEGAPPAGVLAAMTRGLAQGTAPGAFEQRPGRPIEPDSALVASPRFEDPEAPDEDAARLRFLFGAERIASVFRLPVLREPMFGLPMRESRFVPASPVVPVDGLILGRNGALESARPVALTDEARFRHLYVIGQTGTGKSTFLHRLIMQDVEAGHGLCVIDPHGDLSEQVMATMPPGRRDDVALFDPTDLSHPIGFNPLDCANPHERAMVCEEFLTLFHRAWPAEYVGPVFDYTVRNVMMLTMSLADAGVLPKPPTLLAFSQLIVGGRLMHAVIPKIQDPLLKDVALDVQRMASPTRTDGGSMSYFSSKFDVLISRPDVKAIIGQRQTRLDLGRAIDSKKILLVRLPVGQLGEVTARFLGGLLLMKLERSILARASKPAAQRTPYALYIDEFQNFVTESMPVLLAEGRKFGIRLVLANQYLEQLRGSRLADRLVDGIFGNVGSVVAFRVGNQDGEELCRHFGRHMAASDFVSLPNFQALTRILGSDGRPNVSTIWTQPHAVKPDPGVANKCRDGSRRRYSRTREEAEKELLLETTKLKALAAGG